MFKRIFFIIFGLIILLGTPWLANKINNAYVNRHDLFYMARQTLIREHPTRVFLGSSRFYAAVRPDLLPGKTVILAVQYADFLSLEKVLRANIDEIQKAQSLILEVSPELCLLQPSKLLVSHRQRMQNLGVDLPPEWSWPEASEISFYLPSLPMMRWTPQQIMQKEIDQTTEAYSLRKWGYFLQQRQLSDATLSEETKNFVKIVGETADLTQIPLNLAALQRILALLQERKISFAALLMPNPPIYYQARPTYWGPLFDQQVMPILREQKVPLILVDPKLFPDTRDYYDTVHMNDDGAKKFTETLRNYLQGQARE